MYIGIRRELWSSSRIRNIKNCTFPLGWEESKGKARSQREAIIIILPCMCSLSIGYSSVRHFLINGSSRDYYSHLVKNGKIKEAMSNALYSILFYEKYFPLSRAELVNV
jgi:hypothetical protein